MTGGSLTLALMAACALVAFTVGLMRLLRRLQRGGGKRPPLVPLRLLRGLPVPHGLGARPAMALVHFAVTWGWLVMAIRFATLCGRVDDPTYDVLAPWPALSEHFVRVHEWTLLAMLAAFGFVTLRRWVLKPKFLTLSTGAELILFAPILFLAGNLLHESGQVALLVANGVEAGYGVSGAAGEILYAAEFYKSELLAINRAALWAALWGAFLGLGTLPYGRNVHRLLGWLGLAVGDHPGVPRAVTSKHLLDAFNCTECGLCDRQCALHLASAGVRPSRLMVSLRGLKPKLTAEALTKGWQQAFPNNELSDCDQCGECNLACPLSIDLTGALGLVAQWPDPTPAPDPVETAAHE